MKQRLAGGIIIFIAAVLIAATGFSVYYLQAQRNQRGTGVFRTLAVSHGSIEKAKVEQTTAAVESAVLTDTKKEIKPAALTDTTKKEESAKVEETKAIPPRRDLPAESRDTTQEKEKDIRVLTFNIHHGVDMDGKESLDSIINEIRDTGAEIIALQEVDRRMPRSGFKDQVKEIAQGLGFNYVYGETINILGVKYGNALLSIYPIKEYENQKLPSESLETRGLLKAKIDIDGQDMHILTTHLGLKKKEREKQVESINEVVNEKKESLILMGDFNGQPRNTEMEALTKDLVDTAVVLGKEDLNTYAFYSDEPNTRIDRVYVTQDIGVKEHDVKASETSDHSMVIATISQKIKNQEGIIGNAANTNVVSE